MLDASERLGTSESGLQNQAYSNILQKFTNLGSVFLLQKLNQK